MWIIPSRSRPHNLKRLIEASRSTRMSTPAWVRVDDDDPLLDAYLALTPLGGWEMAVGPRLPFHLIYEEARQRASQAFHIVEWYGFLADDVIPQTMYWDRRLKQAADGDGMAVPSGGHDPDGTPHFVLGADLVEEQGWLALPGLSRLYIDTVWADIARAKGVLRRVNDVILLHCHFSNGLALRDAVYEKPSREQDKAIYEQWRQDAEHPIP